MLLNQGQLNAILLGQDLFDIQRTRNRKPMAQARVAEPESLSATIGVPEIMRSWLMNAAGDLELQICATAHN